MPAGKHRSRRYRRVFRRVPSGESKLFYKKRKSQPAQCAVCGAELKGMARLRAKSLHNSPKSKKRPQRMYGGHLCSGCARLKIIEKARKEG